jgi:hypothetical protein
MKGIIISFCPTYLLRPLSHCIFIYFSPFFPITFHCLSFVPLTVIHLPERVHWISWSVMEISLLLFINSGHFIPDEKSCSFCANSLQWIFSDVVRLDPSFHGIDTLEPTDTVDRLWLHLHGTYHSHLKIIFKISKSFVISGFRHNVNENYQSTARKIPK